MPYTQTYIQTYIQTVGRSMSERDRLTYRHMPAHHIYSQTHIQAQRERAVIESARRTDNHTYIHTHTYIQTKYKTIGAHTHLQNIQTNNHPYKHTHTLTTYRQLDS